MDLEHNNIIGVDMEGGFEKGRDILNLSRFKKDVELLYRKINDYVSCFLGFIKSISVVLVKEVFKENNYFLVK